MVAIVTDSTAYFTKAEAASLGIRVLPFSYSVGNYRYHESYADRNGSFIGLISSGNKASTLQTSVTVFRAAFKELIDLGYTVICITMSSRLSGEYNSALAAASNFKSGRVRVVDSLLTGGGLYLLVKKAKALADSGLPAEKIVEKLYVLRNKIYTYFSVDDMGPLRMSRRLGTVRQSVGTSLYRKPVFKIEEGAIISQGSARSSADLFKGLLSRIPSSSTAIIIHCVQPTRFTTALLRAARASHPGVSVQLRPLGPVLAIHLGLSMVGVVWSL